MIEKRPAGNDDENFLRLLYASTRIEEVLAWEWEETQAVQFLDMQWRMQKNAYELQYPDAQQDIVYYEGNQVGRLLLNRTKEAIRIVDISLLASFRNRGIGERLLRGLQCEAAEASQMIELHVMPNNRARHLYEKLDFRLTESIGSHWKMCWIPDRLKR